MCTWQSVIKFVVSPEPIQPRGESSDVNPRPIAVDFHPASASLRNQLPFLCPAEEIGLTCSERR